ncbi:MAG TPA: hypothetical protein VKN36_05340 [Eudoraea sp.]|nr:hypothetical protein [Eudoraea sp.]
MAVIGGLGLILADLYEVRLLGDFLVVSYSAGTYGRRTINKSVQLITDLNQKDISILISQYKKLTKQTKSVLKAQADIFSTDKASILS